MNTETKLTVPTIVCGGCASGIKSALAEVAGVGAIDVDIETKIVTVEHDESVSREQITETLDDAGFPAE